LAGALEPGDGFITRPTFSAPHHDASKASLVGGGSGQVRPGEISRAHAGVLFLDEFPLFRHDIIEALRQPLESGDITVARAEESVTLPARGMLVLACNPCPCGDWSDDHGKNRCRCKAVALREYRSKLTGPLADRIDITRVVMPVKREKPDPFGHVETSAEVRARVTAARARQHERYADCSWRLNAHVPSPVLRDRWPLTEAAQRVVDQDLYAGRISSRGAVRVQRLAWTLADLESVTSGRDVVPGQRHASTALQLRKGEPLPVRVVLGRAG
jgi:magnesium chelatase family protein